VGPLETRLANFHQTIPKFPVFHSRGDDPNLCWPAQSRYSTNSSALFAASVDRPDQRAGKYMKLHLPNRPLEALTHFTSSVFHLLFETASVALAAVQRLRKIGSTYLCSLLQTVRLPSERVFFQQEFSALPQPSLIPTCSCW